jgi:hypothetical protein
VWGQRFPDGSAVETATGFGTLNSSQIAFSAGPQSYMAQAHAAMAGLMLRAGLTPKLQFGEILWWFLANLSGMAFYDADTQAAAQSALGRALATFHTPNDDPSVNSYADANFLRTRLYSYVAAIQSSVLSQCPSAVFELLWPMDVNDPDNCKLLRYINLPSQWTTRAGSGFDTFLIEGYQYPGINHDLDQATRCAQYPYQELAWDQAHCRYLMGLYYGAWSWMREFVNASRLGLPAIKLWAYFTTTCACSDGRCRCPRATTVRLSTDHLWKSSKPTSTRWLRSPSAPRKKLAARPGYRSRNAARHTQWCTVTTHEVFTPAQLETWNHQHATLVQGKGRDDGEGVVTHVPPLHGVAIDEVLHALQRQTQEECADGAPDFLTAVPGEQEQEECCARKGQPVDFAVQAHNRPGPGGLQGPDDQEQEPCLGDAANDPCALLQCVFDGDSPPDSRIKGIAPKPSGRGGNPGDGKVRSRTGRV